MHHRSPTALIILDGFGFNPHRTYNAIANAKTPNLDAWFASYPHTLLKASGEAVGLLPGTIGTSEVGHLTIGAGRIIPESVLRIHQSIDDGSFFTIPTLTNNLKKLQQSGGKLHIMGLLSDAGVHSHEKHLYALIKAAFDHGIKEVYVHPFLDGRDVPPRSALTYLDRLVTIFKQYNCGKIGSIHGRFYAMDRDNNWDRTQQSYEVLTQEQQKVYDNWHEVIEQHYAQGITDEFIPPFQVDPQGIVTDNDGIIFFNFRADRARQLTRCFLYPASVPFTTKKISLCFFIGATDYDHSYENEFLLAKAPVTNTFKDVLAAHHKTMMSIAETEKYAHVTYFFGGGTEKEKEGEKWILIPSIKTKDYVHHPEMSAPQITDAVLKSLRTEPRDFYLINYANADMVGHSGNYESTIKAVECLDRELKKIYDVLVEQMGGTMYITSDHGNAEYMFDEIHQQPKTSHTLNPVPFIVIRKGLSPSEKLPVHELSDIAPFILQQLQLPVPAQMQKK